MPETFRPIRPHIRQFPKFNTKPFDPRTSTFIPRDSVENKNIRGNVSPRKMRLIGGKAFNAGSQSCSDDTNRYLGFPDIAFDQGGFFSTLDTAVLTFPYDGIYLVAAYAEFVSNTTGRRRMTLFFNGVADISDVIGATAAAAMAVKITLPTKRTAGDTLKVQVYQNSGGGLDVNGTEPNNFVSAIFMGGI